MKNYIATLALILSTLCLKNAAANDTLATVSDLGIHYDKSKDITLTDERLHISIDQIKVQYTFINESDKEITSDVAFPLPPFQDPGIVWDDAYIAHKLLEQAPDSRNLYSYVNQAPFLNFQSTANGIPSVIHSRFIALLPDGKDITELLKKHHIPISALLLKGWYEQGWISKHPHIKKTLQALKLLDSKGNPLWTNQTTYFWQQKFPPLQALVVEHSYKPATGHIWLQNNGIVKDLNSLSLANGTKNLRSYCLTPEFEKQLLELFHKGKASKGETQYHQVYEVAYVLKTGANWKGPIRHFSLEISPPPDTLTTFCAPNGAQIHTNPDGTIGLELKDFTPTQDLKILFIKKYPQL